jgi:hypothetical protein
MSKTMRRLVGMTVAAAALVAATALPASAGVTLQAAGTAACEADGTYRITWVLSLPGNSPGEEPYPVTLNVEEAVLSGAVSGPVVFSPDPWGGTVEPDDPDVVTFTTSGTTIVPGTTSGTVTLDVVVYYEEPDFDLDATVSVDLDGTCRPAATSTSTTGATATTAATASLTATPRFTG